MSDALDLYLEQRSNKSVKFCVILHNTLRSSEKNWPRERDRVIELLKHPNYQSVLEGRPLVYSFLDGDFPFERFNEIREKAQGIGINPYFVYMAANAVQNFPNIKLKGFDAVSAYTYGSNHASFKELSEAVEKSYWGQAKRKRGALYSLCYHRVG